jgi:SAM-dependent methyltransferase/uncharacterized protein YbaR (Trm112 family)
VKPGFAPSLRCPNCHGESTLRLDATASDEREAREGTLVCARCAIHFPLKRGVPELLWEPPPYVVAESNGLERFAAVMREAGWDREMVLLLPYVEHGYWYAQARSMHQLLTTVPFAPGQSILDVGANTCWAANHFARRGLRAVALDIATIELQGLYTADWFLQDGEVFFERVRGSMDDIPLVSSSLDYVYCCEVLHHNDKAALRRALAEIFRVLRPGGMLLMVNETLKTLRDPSGVNVEDVEQFEGNEHAHWAMRYRLAAARAGFLTQVAEPHYRPFFGDRVPPPQLGRLARAAFGLRRSRLARRAYLSWLNHVWGGVSMNMIAIKPSRFVGRHEGMGAPQRALRTGLAAAALARNRVAGRAPARLPRSPEEADARIHAAAR